MTTERSHTIVGYPFDSGISLGLMTDAAFPTRARLGGEGGGGTGGIQYIEKNIKIRVKNIRDEKNNKIEVGATFINEV